MHPRTPVHLRNYSLFAPFSHLYLLREITEMYVSIAKKIARFSATESRERDFVVYTEQEGSKSSLVCTFSYTLSAQAKRSEGHTLGAYLDTDSTYPSVRSIAVKVHGRF